ncbi:MAG: hypothetical protein ACFCUM_04810 [Bacteroidales bacterium]
MSAKLKFLNSLLFFSALVFLTGYAVFSLLLRDYFLPVSFVILVYFILLTFAGRVILLSGSTEASGNFNIRYFMVRWIKVFFHLTFIVIYLFIDRDNAFAFILTFLAAYIIYSLFDVYTLGIYLKKK